MTVCTHCQTPNEGAAATCFTCGQPLSAAIIRGQVISSRYEILKPLGTGGMGAVYLAHDRELDEKVAIKVLRIDLARSEEMAARFRQEIKLARRVRHKNVCGIHEYGDERGLRYIAMEYLEGIDLRKVLQRRGRMAVDEAVAVTIQIAEGLHAIHEVGIVHRDLKTPNVMVDARGQVRLMDFGIAKQVDAGTGATATGMIVGTPEYMSPEQIRGARVDGRSDVYALGIVFFELLTGDVPFRGDTPVATLMKHLREPVPMDSPQLLTVPARVRTLLTAMLAKEPGARPAGADAVARALREVQSHAGSDAPPSKRPLAAAFDGALALDPAAETTPGPLPATEVNSAPTTMPTGTAAGPVVTTRASQGQIRKLALWSGGVALVVATVVVLGIPHVRSPATPQASLQAPPVSIPAATTMVPRPPSQDADRAGTIDPNSTPPRVAPRQAEAKPRARTTPSTLPAVEDVAVSPAPAPTPAPSLIPPSVTQPAAPGLLRVVAIPWAQVTVDGVSKGATPFPSISLSPGTHVLVLKHPAYEPLERRVSIRPGAAEMVRVDFKSEGIAKQR